MMFVFPKESLEQVLSYHEGVSIVSYGKPRDAFKLPIDVPHWTSGYGGKYEMVHTHVPAGVMVAIGNLEELDLSDQAKLKDQLANIDIYPTGEAGDFSGKKIQDLTKWFTDRSRVDNAVNDQKPIAHVKKLTPSGLGPERYNDLVSHLADGMNIFKCPQQRTLVPADHEQRVEIVKSILDGLSRAVRYTRMDDPAIAFQITDHVLLDIASGSGGGIELGLEEAAKIIVERKDKKTGKIDFTPLDRDMLGKSWVVADGKPLGHRGEIDASDIALEADELAHPETPPFPQPYMRRSSGGMTVHL
jgi:hypothetical protein